MVISPVLHVPSLCLNNDSNDSCISTLYLDSHLEAVSQLLLQDLQSTAAQLHTLHQCKLKLVCISYKSLVCDMVFKRADRSVHDRLL